MLDLQTSWSSTRLPAECSTEEGCNGVHFTHTYSEWVCRGSPNFYVGGYEFMSHSFTQRGLGQNGLVPSTVPIRAVNGEHLAVSGEADVLLQVRQHQTKYKVLVVDDMSQQIILGTDYLEP